MPWQRWLWVTTTLPVEYRTEARTVLTCNRTAHAGGVQRRGVVKNHPTGRLFRAPREVV
jgi:hypothetical protein